ncbi:hypothetical protein Vafri_1575 [Volvox africanus]|nr:hypothetical protein Vafri_1575 [Volvox africanus]
MEFGKRVRNVFEGFEPGVPARGYEFSYKQARPDEMIFPNPNSQINNPALVNYGLSQPMQQQALQPAAQLQPGSVQQGMQLQGMQQQGMQQQGMQPQGMQVTAPSMQLQGMMFQRVPVQGAQLPGMQPQGMLQQGMQQQSMLQQGMQQQGMQPQGMQQQVVQQQGVQLANANPSNLLGSAIGPMGAGDASFMGATGPGGMGQAQVGLGPQAVYLHGNMPPQQQLQPQQQLNVMGSVAPGMGMDHQPQPVQGMSTFGQQQPATAFEYQQQARPSEQPVMGDLQQVLRQQQQQQRQVMSQQAPQFEGMFTQQQAAMEQRATNTGAVQGHMNGADQRGNMGFAPSLKQPPPPPPRKQLQLPQQKSQPQQKQQSQPLRQQKQVQSQQKVPQQQQPASQQKQQKSSAASGSSVPQQLPGDATSSLYLDNLPPDVTHRELTHIFRPYAGFVTLRLVVKDNPNRPNEKTAKAFIDFNDIQTATAAMSALNGYRLDMDGDTSHVLRPVYARPLKDPATVNRGIGSTTVLDPPHPGSKASSGPRIDSNNGDTQKRAGAEPGRSTGPEATGSGLQRGKPGSAAANTYIDGGFADGPKSNGGSKPSESGAMSLSGNERGRGTGPSQGGRGPMREAVRPGPGGLMRMRGPFPEFRSGMEIGRGPDFGPGSGFPLGPGPIPGPVFGGRGMGGMPLGVGGFGMMESRVPMPGQGFLGGRGRMPGGGIGHGR